MACALLVHNFFLHILTALAESLVTCFYELELDQLAGLFKKFVDMEANPTQLTAFGPPNKAIQEKIRLINGLLINDAVDSLFVGSLQPSWSLDDGSTFISLSGLFLHITKLEPPLTKETVSSLVTLDKYVYTSLVTVNHNTCNIYYYHC